MKTNTFCNSLKPARRFKASILTASIVAVLAMTHAGFSVALPPPSNENTAYGEGALPSLNNGSLQNSAFGYWALHLNTTGYQNTANGANALYSNTTGSANTATGMVALASNTTGYYNTATGQSALSNNTTGIYNTANGYGALDNNTTGYYNTASGALALVNSTGGSNTGDGFQALASNTTGGRNTANGFRALSSNTIGSNNTALGYAADVTTGALTNATAIGYGAKVNASNKVRIGNTAVTKIEGQVPLTTTSDKRLKNNINDLPLGLDFITKLRPVEYIRNNNTAKTKEWGVIAQELQQTLTDVGYKNAGVVEEDNSPEKYMTVRYNDLLAPMIKAIQEQNKTIQDQEKINREQQQTIATLLKEVEALKKK